MQLSVGIGDESPSRVTMDVLRGGRVIAENQPVTSGYQAWADRTSADLGKVSHCCSVRLRYTSSDSNAIKAMLKKRTGRPVDLLRGQVSCLRGGSAPARSGGSASRRCSACGLRR